MSKRTSAKALTLMKAAYEKALKALDHQQSYEVEVNWNPAIGFMKAAVKQAEKENEKEIKNA